VIGNRQLLLDEGVSVAVADEEAGHAESLGHTAVFIAVGGRAQAVLSLRDELRPGARAAVQRIFDQGMEVVLLSGDHRATVEAIARNLDIAHVKAELLPEDRGAEVRRLRDTGGAVVTVGRPEQDDGALAAADVPVVLGAAGGPAGDRGVALASDDVRDAAAALWIARAARSEATRGAMFTATVGALLVAASVVGLVAPAVAALFAMAVDAFILPAGARLLRRIELRVPART
jgi:Cu+-exporting ATPase